MRHFDIQNLEESHLLRLAEALQQVLNSRTHKHTHLGEEIIVEGSLSKALKLPEIIKFLESNENKRHQARARLDDIWWTLSETTRQKSMELAEIYEPDKLDWDDPRSNRYPSFTEKE